MNLGLDLTSLELARGFWTTEFVFKDLEAKWKLR